MHMVRAGEPKQLALVYDLHIGVPVEQYIAWNFI